MTHTRLLAILLALLSAFTALGVPSLEPPRPGEALYLVVLGERPIEPDVTALGARLIRSWGNRRLVAIPADRAGELQRQPSVSYIQSVWTGEAGASPRRGISSEGAVPTSQLASRATATIRTNTAAPQWTTGVYQYDGSGNIKSIGNVEEVGGVSAQTYRYDHVGRLAYSRVQGEQKTYSYDPYGNLLQLGTRQVTVNQANNRLTTPTDPMGTIAYDAVGNRHRDAAGREYFYDPLGMVTAIDLLATDPGVDLRMIYSPDEERIVISEGRNPADPLESETMTYRLRDFNNKVLREWRSSSEEIPEWERDYIYAEGSLVAGEVQVDQSRNGMRHYHTDHLGSIRLVTDGARDLVAEHNYEPFGGEAGSTTTEANNTGKTLRDPLKFTGHERDYFTGANLSADNEDGDYVDYMHARYYTPTMGRFLSVDPIVDGKRALTTPQMWNRYTYVTNNPLNRIDPDGRRAQFVGSDADQKKALELLQANLRSADRKFVTIGKNGAMNVDLKAKGGYGLKRLQAIAKDSRLVTVRLGTTATHKVAPGPSQKTTKVLKDGGGGLAVPANLSTSGNVEVHVDPAGDALSAARVMGHELIGHGWDLLFNKKISTRTQAENSAKTAENTLMREIGRGDLRRELEEEPKP